MIMRKKMNVVFLLQVLFFIPL